MSDQVPVMQPKQNWVALVFAAIAHAAVRTVEWILVRGIDVNFRLVRNERGERSLAADVRLCSFTVDGQLVQNGNGAASPANSYRPTFPDEKRGA